MKRTALSDEELEKKYTYRLEIEKKKYENLIKEILLENQAKNDELQKQVFVANEHLTDYRKNYISKYQHEFTVNRLTNELKEINNKYTELETKQNKFEINQENYIFVCKDSLMSRRCRAIILKDHSWKVKCLSLILKYV